MSLMPTPLLDEFASILGRAGRIAQEARTDFGRELKPDGSIVTNGDRLVEEFLRDELPAFVSGSTVWGEELGFAAPGEGGLWVVDPVDGTSNYAFGSPIWGVTAALIQDGRLTLGGVVLPDLGEIYLAGRGQGGFRNGTPLQPLPPGPIRPEELVSYSDAILRAFGDHPWPGKVRCSGAFVVDGVWVASGRFRGLVGMNERLYDVGACVLLAEELGAEVRYADGAGFDLGPLMAAPDPIGRPWVIFPRESGLVVD
jgi:myo-inositol-1(or 4)-monophosphatase